MTLGIIALVVCCCPFAGWIVGSIAVSMANTDLTAMKSGYMDDSGQGNTTAGKICGTIAVGLATAIFVFNIITWVMNPFHF